MAAGMFILASTAAFFESGVERLERRSVWHGSKEVGPGILYQGFDLAFVIAFTRTAKPLLKQIMAYELRKSAGTLAFPIPENAGHRNFEVVI
jgi:hypothetical protein